MKEEQNVESSETQENQDFVEITDASQNDLDAFLSSSESEEVQKSEDHEQEATQERQAVQPSQKPQASEEYSDTQKLEVAAKPRQYSSDEIAVIEAENKRLKTSNEQKERFIQQRNSELGELRKLHGEKSQSLLTRRKQLQEGLQEKYDLDPVAAADDRDSIKEIDAELAEIKHEGGRAEKIVRSQSLFHSLIDTNKVSVEDMANVLRADGVSEDFVSAMKANPWEFADGGTLVQMAKRAEEMKSHKKAIGDLGILAQHIRKQEGEIQKLRGKPSQMLNNVQRHLNQTPPVTSGNGTSAEDARPMVDPTRMSTDELNSYLKNTH